MKRMQKVKKFVGVYYRESVDRMHMGKPDKCYYITYRNKSQKFIYEKVGWTSEGYTAGLASRLRGQRVMSVRHGDVGLTANSFPASERDFKQKYKKLYRDRSAGLADIVDRVFADLDLPIDFKKITAIIRNTKRKTIPQKLRFEILERDNSTCNKCGRSAPDVKVHVDHITPVARGGLTEERNLWVLCDDCNFGKSDRVCLLKQVGESK